jgi:DNA repair protein RecO (recombination protein O)
VEEIRTRAFVLRTRSYGESDVIAVLLSAEHGKLSGIARGARRSRRRFAGPALEPFQELDVRLGRRPHSDLAFLHECSVVTSHHALASDIDAYAWASYLCELTEVMTPERDACPELYRLFRDLLDRLTGGAPAAAASHRYVLALLDWAGWGPDFSRCSMCDRTLYAASRPIVDPRGSGLMCVTHEAEARGADPEDPEFEPSRRVVDDELLTYVRGLRAEAAGAETTHEVPVAATALLHRLVDLHLHRPLKSRAFLATITSAGPVVPKAPSR